MVGEDSELSGPLVKGAFLCESVIDQKDGVNSYVRVVEQLGVEARIAPASNAPGVVEEPPLLPPGLPGPAVLTPWLVLMFSASGATGTYEVSSDITTPTGRRFPLSPPQSVTFDDRHTSGVNLHAHLTLIVRSPGDYTIHVYLGQGDVKREVTRVPFEVVFRTRP